MIKILVIYLLFVNLGCYILYGIDKKAAIDGKWRIPEKVLLLIPVLGGSIGGILGMQIFRHKTKHWYFRYGLPCILLIQIATVILLKTKQVL